ncbi:PEP-CTERM sorting domain-containing protein [Allorhodopirellula solitaria]|uniref:PEP-CTERM sorting domain-containing protein n=1 Tax=Allorhodopirellula solitaria TaxID=2527987 RepID=UPI001646E45E
MRSPDAFAGLSGASPASDVFTFDDIHYGSPIAVPEPSSVLGICAVLACSVFLRRKK